MPANLENLAVATGLEKVSFQFQSQRKEMPKNVQTTAQLHSSYTLASALAWRIPGTHKPGGCCLWGLTESDTTEAT